MPHLLPLTHRLRSGLFALGCLPLLTAISAATANAEETPSFSPVDIEFFESKIRPVLLTRCFECHSEQGKGIKGGLRLDARAEILAGGDSGPALIPRKPAESLLIEAIHYKQDGLQMPPRGKLPAAEIELLTEWVRRGAPFPDGASGEGPAKRRAGIDFDAGRRHWSFQPVREQPLPRGKSDARDDQRVDAFIFAKLQAAGLAPTAEADCRTLLRRLSFDLIGLPPTTAEIAAFIADTSPGAYERQVERLLASPHYGEKWGRFWLDLVRYCDIPEVWSVEPLARAWLYRDWVVQAWNNDLPYHRYLELQLAADLAPDAEPADIAALGFLGLSPTYWKELKLDPSVIKSVVAEEWEERIHTLSGAVLGLTVACARCHDHKQDPISQEDYYALAGVFASTKLAPRPPLPPTEAQALLAAHQRVDAFQKERESLKQFKPALPEATLLDAALVRQIQAIEESTPYFRSPLAYAADEASLDVLPDGPDRTRLVYRPGEPQNVALQVRGNPANPGPVIPRRFLTVLSPSTPKPFQQGSGRRELAQAFSREAAPLTARVIVNRIWQQHFGQGLVDTPSNFGTTGSKPTHPELLDDLAARFIAHGWSLKWLHRELVQSAAYRQSSVPDAAKFAIDPDNRLLWRANRRRLEIEAWRDAMLVATGRLDPQIGGPDLDLDTVDNHRRTLYATVKRRDLNTMLRLNDFPDPATHTASRDVTTTPLQQLFVLNSPFIREQAAALANRICKDGGNDLDHRVRYAYQILFGREPTPKQMERAGEFFHVAEGQPEMLAELWRQYAQALLGSNEFAFVD